MREMNIIAEGLGEPVRISIFLKRELLFSSAMIKRVKHGGVFINGENVHMRATVKNGDAVRVCFPDERNEELTADAMTLDIIYEDDYVVAVNKPTNMPTHPSKGNHLPTLANGLKAYFGDGFIFRAITRLDKDTSGIVLIAKDQYTASRLSAAMKRGDFTKKYLAIVEGCPEPSYGLIDAPIERESEDSVRRTVRADGKPSQTEYKVIEPLPSGNALCMLTLLTGRTHQIRVHLAHVGHPLVGDPLYGTATDGGYALHCSLLRFTHPTTDEPIEFISIPSFAKGLADEEALKFALREAH